MPSAGAKLLHVCSTDDFFMRIDGSGQEVYNFDRRAIGRNHAHNQERVRLAARMGVTPIFIDNTNMSGQEVWAYTKIARNYSYAVQIVKPEQIEPRWRELRFLVQRNQNRLPVGKDIDEETLKRMLGRYEALGKSRKNRGASQKSPAEPKGASQKSLPEYFGVNLEEAMVGSGSAYQDLWAETSSALRGYIDDPKDLEAGRLARMKPLHVTTFHANDVKGSASLVTAVVENASAQRGRSVKLTIEAVVLVAGYLACALVTNADPPLATPWGKLLHITLGTRGPWRPVQSNDLLRAVLGPSIAPEGITEANLWRFQRLDLSSHKQYVACAPGGVVRFDKLQVGPHRCDAFLVRLPRPMVVTGPFFRFG